MTFGIFLAVLFAALLHATWNALIKGGGSRLHSMMVLTMVQGMQGLAIAMLFPWPAAEVWPWLLASAVFHTAYKLFLLNAYEHGDLSRVYPIARGTAPFIVLMLSGFLLTQDSLKPTETLGVVILICGILAMARGIFAAGESRRMLPFALGSAMATAGYSIVDGMGARVAGNATMYIGWLFALDMLLTLPVASAIYRRLPVPRLGRVWIGGALAATASLIAYWIVVWAMTLAPIALVTALRETSILFAVLMGWLLFREPMPRAKWIAAGLILAGVILSRL